MASDFIKGTATFTSGSTTVSGVTLTQNTLAGVDEGTIVKVSSDPVIDSVEAVQALSVNSFQLRHNWPHTTGTYEFMMNFSPEQIKGARAAFQGGLDALNAVTANSLLKTANLSDLDDDSESRDNLGLGTAATKDVQTSSTDSTTDMALLTQFAFASDSNNYHTGNVGTLTFGRTPDGTQETVNISDSFGVLDIERPFTSNSAAITFYNPNGNVGSIRMSGSSTSFNTSSDPRHKNFLDDPNDEEIDNYFNRILDAAAVFTWKSGLDSEIVWGFNAHKAIDNGLHMGSEGRGPRELPIGTVYESATYDSDGNVITPAKIVTGAGVDQSKDIAALVYKIDQLERRLAIIESNNV